MVQKIMAHYNSCAVPVVAVSSLLDGCLAAQALCCVEVRMWRCSAVGKF